MGRALFGVRGPRWEPSTRADTAVVGGVCAVALALSSSPVLRGIGPPGAAHLVLTVATAAAVAGAAILAEVTGRIRDDPRWSWTAAALALYGAVVLPASALALHGDTPRLVVVRVVASLAAVPLLLVSLRPPHRFGPGLPWVLAAAAGGLALASLALPPDIVPLRAVAVVVVLLVLPGWAVAALGYVVEGHRRPGGPRLQLGLGLAVIAGAQLYRAATGVGIADPTVGALRLAGGLVVLVALARLAARALAAVRSEQWAQQEELGVAALHVERARELAAERDHELRNGLAGLAGITHLLSTDADDGEQQRLKQAVLSELTRLHTILDGGAVADANRAPGPNYAVEPVLAGLVTLRRSAGTRITLQVEAGLRARGDSAVLAQVVTNLLANCDRHAPGAPVAVRAYRSTEQVVVEVRDEGPGVGATPGSELVERGVHDPAAGGSGLGLHISARLLDGEDGELDLRSAVDPPGCVAAVRVPVGATPERPATGPSGDAPVARPS